MIDAHHYAPYDGPKLSYLDALATGMSRYFTGAVCKHGHVSQRLTANRSCAECMWERRRQNSANYKKYQATWRRAKRSSQPDDERAKARARYKASRDIILLQTQASQLRHRDKVAERKARKYSEQEYAARRDRSLRALYGIGHADYLAMYQAQRGCCAICSSPQDVLHVDHDHATSRVRGLLCANCNRAIGLFKDDPAIMVAASEYVGERK